MSTRIDEASVRQRYDTFQPGKGRESIPDKPSIIDFHHPGYENGLFLSLPALDVGGTLDSTTARIACGILAGNRWDGFFSESKEPTPILGPLMKTRYFFHVADDSDYPLCPTFDDWQFPASLPQEWEIIKRQEGSKGGCCITNEIPIIERAHLCPRTHEQWFQRNHMYRFNRMTGETRNINHSDNIISMRADIHTAFDRRWFTIKPKAEKLVVQMLVDQPQYSQLYHNVEIYPVSASTEHLFCRFAWSIFGETVRQFLSAGVSRRVLLKGGTISKLAQPDECLQLLEEAKSRSQSPKKRSRTESAGRSLGNTRQTKRSRYSDSGIDSSFDFDNSESDFERRGRSRTRKVAKTAEGVARGKYEGVGLDLESECRKRT
jgi:hypothetical protein